MNIEIQLLMPEAISWAQEHEALIKVSGKPLDDPNMDAARRVGVSMPQMIRILEVDWIPKPSHPELQRLAVATGLLGPGTLGLTLGYGIYVRRGHASKRLLTHEFRHVHQYEKAGSIPEFLQIYIQQILDFGYMNAPLEVDARAYELNN